MSEAKLPEPALWEDGPFDPPAMAFTAAQMHAFRAEGVALERERCANVVRYWLAGYAADTVASHEARCLTHVLDGRPAPSAAIREGDSHE